MATTERIEIQLTSMLDTVDCWELLERVAHGSHLKHAPRLQELLLFIGKRSLKEGCIRLQEQEIGAKVFHRPDSYDTSQDNIVRTRVSDLRRRIEAYFHSDGSHETLLMEIPRGSYIPVFRPREPQAEVAPLSHSQAPESGTKTTGATSDPWVGIRQNWWIGVPWIVAGIAIVALSGAILVLWNQTRVLNDSIYEWQREPSVSAFWSRLMDADSNTNVVTSDAGFGIVESLSQKQFSLNDYITRSYVSQLNSANLSPEMNQAIHRILGWDLANPYEFRLARRILALDPPGRKIHLFNARNYMPELIKRDNVILIGARKSNPWDELFDGRMNFNPDFNSPRVMNRNPSPGEQPSYANSDSVGYSVVAYMPKLDHNGTVLLIEGTTAEATEAAGDFLFSEGQLARFKKILHVGTLPYFQILLKVSLVRGTPLSSQIEAYRTYANMH
jgi:hypothetical protein